MTSDNKTYAVYSINGPVIGVKGKTALSMQEMVFVGESRLIGEVISITDERTTIQVYESTTGLRPGEIVEGTGAPITVTLGPGLLGGIYDGIARPLDKIRDISGAFIGSGIDVKTIDTAKFWDVTILSVSEGDAVRAGTPIATVAETESILHTVMIPPGITSGTVAEIAQSGKYTVTDVIASVRDDDGRVHEIRMQKKWPIRIARPSARRLASDVPLITGQRAVDALFPIARGGAAAIPGGFGTGKTMLQHQLAKWSDADIIVYVGCGERGNEMTQVLHEFTELADPRTGRSMLERTVLIANTSNMPVAAREASIYTGVTIAEYYRDMGYDVAMMADSTSRWAEALREISGRLEEMPAEEGFPAYLPSRLSAFYERAGCVETLGGRDGSVSIIGAVSPQGNDFSEPVTQNTKRFTRCFWALDKSLAYARHYPAINWMDSYSEYASDLEAWFAARVADDFPAMRSDIIRILGEENNLMEIVRLIGSDLLADDQKLTLETAKVIRTGFLQQNAMDDTDCFVPIHKQYMMMKSILMLHEKARELIANQIPISQLREAGVFDRVSRMKYEIPNDESGKQKIEEICSETDAKLRAIEERYR